MSLMSKNDFSAEDIQKLEDPQEKIAKYGVYNRDECLKDRGECEYKVADAMERTPRMGCSS